MNGIFSYLKSYVILFLVLTILLEMVPKAVLAWSGSAVRVSNPTGNGLDVFR